MFIETDVLINTIFPLRAAPFALLFLVSKWSVRSQWTVWKRLLMWERWRKALHFTHFLVAANRNAIFRTIRCAPSLSIIAINSRIHSAIAYVSAWLCKQCISSHSIFSIFLYQKKNPFFDRCETPSAPPTRAVSTRASNGSPPHFSIECWSAREWRANGRESMKEQQGPRLWLRLREEERSAILFIYRTRILFQQLDEKFMHSNKEKTQCLIELWS